MVDVTDCLALRDEQGEVNMSMKQARGKIWKEKNIAFQ